MCSGLLLQPTRIENFVEKNDVRCTREVDSFSAISSQKKDTATNATAFRFTHGKRFTAREPALSKLSDLYFAVNWITTLFSPLAYVREHERPGIVCHGRKFLCVLIQLNSSSSRKCHARKIAVDNFHRHFKGTRSASYGVRGPSIGKKRPWSMQNLKHACLASRRGGIVAKTAPGTGPFVYHTSGKFSEFARLRIACTPMLSNEVVSKLPHKNTTNPVQRLLKFRKYNNLGDLSHVALPEEEKGRGETRTNEYSNLPLAHMNFALLGTPSRYPATS